MNLFDLLIVQPIFNVLMLIYGILPGSDFGITIIIFTVIVRLIMWPLVKKQLHQTRVMRSLQPELKKIKARAKGNKQLESQLMMELYRERGVSPFGAIGLLLVQLPVFFALFRVINMVTQQRDQIGSFTYNFLENLEPVRSIIDNPAGFNETLLNIVDLTRHGIEAGSIYWPAIIIGIIAAGFQFVQSKQIMPQTAEKKRLRDMLKDQAAGKQIDQGEVSAIISGRMIYVLPAITLMVSLYLPAALVLYYATQSIVAVIQQRAVLNKDVDEMEALADKNPTAKTRADQAQTAEIVPTTKKKARRKRKK